MQTTTHPKSGTLYGILALISLIVMTSLCFIPILIIGVFKLIPIESWRIACTKGVDHMVVIWTGMTTGYVKRFCPVEWKVMGTTQFNPQQWYLVIVNHQSWLDILILQNFFHQKIPVLKFFIKAQLKWVPLFGFAWWAMGCPFMKRYSKEYIAQNPHKKGDDIKATQKALKLFKSYPSTLINFIEGTRYTPEKHVHQQSPYLHLLKPRAGGVGQIISAMGQQLQQLIDVTIVYPSPNVTLWDFLCRRIHTISLNVRQLEVPEIFTCSEDALQDSYTQDSFRAWINDQWATKDELITVLKESGTVYI